jgi:hypothetical protein
MALLLLVSTVSLRVVTSLPVGAVKEIIRHCRTRPASAQLSRGTTLV